MITFDQKPKINPSLGNLLLDFEVEFCLKRKTYCRIYNEDGSLWDEEHKKHIKIFRDIFISEEGRAEIKEQVEDLFHSYFKEKDELLKSFSKNEFSPVEYDFLEYEISFLKPWDDEG